MLECSTSVISYCTDHNTYAAILYPGHYTVYCILVYYRCSWISPTLWLGSRSPSIRWSSSAGPETIKETVRSHYYYHVSGSEDARETSYINNIDNNHQRPRVKNHFKKFNWKFWKNLKKKLKMAFRFLSLSSGAESKRHQSQRQHYWQCFQMAAASSIVRGSRSCFQF